MLLSNYYQERIIMISYKLKICAVACLLAMGSCSDDFLEPQVTTGKDVVTSINTVQDLNTVLAGALDRMNAALYYGRDFVIFGEVRSDNAFSTGSSGRFIGPGQFFLNPTDAYPSDTWSQMYGVIANVNIIINSDIEESAEVNQVKGQAYTLRALAYMDLLRLYGQQWVEGSDLGVPLVTEFRGEDLTPSRATAQAVWDQIGSDLQTAESLMTADLNGSSNYITSWAVKALQSRYYLYTGQWAEAAAAAAAVIESGEYSIASNWEGEADGSDDIIFGLAFNDTDNLNNNSLQYILNETNYGDIEATADLYNLYEETDIRQDWYTIDGSMIRMTGKYASYGEDVKVIRYAEVLLNYAEALVKLGDAAGAGEALETINLIAEKRGATPYTEATLENVLAERRKELAFEGHRSFDLLRNGMGIPNVDPGQTFDDAGIPYGSPSLAFPIPQSELNANSNIEQNLGY